MEPHKRKDIAKALVTILVLALILLTLVCIPGCNKPENSATETCSIQEHKGIYSLVHIGNGLYYDSETGIVYWWGGVMGYSSSATVPSAYYSSNGLLCKYNSDTGHIEEISK